MEDAIPLFDETALESLDSVIQSISRSLIGGDLDLNHIIQTLLDNLHLAGFDCVVFALVDENRTRIQGRLSSGKSAAEFVNEFLLPMRAGSNAPWQKSTDLLVGKVDEAATDYEPAIAAFRSSLTERSAAASTRIARRRLPDWRPRAGRSPVRAI